MTYHFSTVEMFNNANEYTDGFVGQRKFKTSFSNYLIVFNTTKQVSKLLMTMFNSFSHC